MNLNLSINIPARIGWELTIEQLLLNGTLWRRWPVRGILPVDGGFEMFRINCQQAQIEIRISVLRTLINGTILDICGIYKSDGFNDCWRKKPLLRVKSDWVP